MLADPPTYDDALSGPDAKGWIASMGEERKSLIDHCSTGSIRLIMLN